MSQCRIDLHVVESRLFHDVCATLPQIFKRGFFVRGHFIGYIIKLLPPAPEKSNYLSVVFRLYYTSRGRDVTILLAGGDSTPFGNAAACRRPQAHSRVSALCSVTLIFGCGMLRAGIAFFILPRCTVNDPPLTQREGY
jgi:hypothetical protein